MDGRRRAPRANRGLAWEHARLTLPAKREGSFIVDWASKEDVQREMRQRIKQSLRVAKFGDSTKVEAATAKIMDLARARRKR